MIPKVFFVAAVLCFITLGQPCCYASPGRAKENKEKEEKLVAKIGRENNPGKKARLQLRLARMKLIEASEAYDHNDLEKGWALLQEYRKQIDASWTTLKESRRGVSKHFEAYKRLEIGLREDARVLEDLRHRVPYPESDSIEKIAKESIQVHSQVLGVLFPPGRPPQKSKKPGRSSGVLAARPAAEA
jgi:DNA gyrase/topoisomerase IV subunit A